MLHIMLMLFEIYIIYIIIFIIYIYYYYLYIVYSQPQNEYAGCVAYMLRKMWLRELESFTLYAQEHKLYCLM